MTNSGVKEAALRLRALADRGGPAESADRAVLPVIRNDAVIERRLEEQAATIDELCRQVAELSELIRSAPMVTPHDAATHGPVRTGRRMTLFVAFVAAALGLVGGAWAHDDLLSMFDQALRLAGVAVRP